MQVEWQMTPELELLPEKRFGYYSQMTNAKTLLFVAIMTNASADVFIFHHSNVQLISAMKFP